MRDKRFFTRPQILAQGRKFMFKGLVPFDIVCVFRERDLLAITCESEIVLELLDDGVMFLCLAVGVLESVTRMNYVGLWDARRMHIQCSKLGFPLFVSRNGCL